MSDGIFLCTNCGFSKAYNFGTPEEAITERMMEEGYHPTKCPPKPRQKAMFD